MIAFVVLQREQQRDVFAREGSRSDGGGGHARFAKHAAAGAAMGF